MKLRIAGAQLPVTECVPRNEEAIGRAIDFAAGEEADILLTPEGSLSGYTPAFDAAAVDAALERVCAAARQATVGLALGTCLIEAADGRCYNQVRFYDRAGEFLGFHSKTLTCGSLTVPPRGECEAYAVAPLRTYHLPGHLPGAGDATSAGPLCVGALICNDLWANPGCTPGPDPHLTHQLATMGARVIFHAVNGGRDGGDFSRDVAWPYHESNVLMRARASGLWIATVDSCHPEEHPCSAPSGIASPQGTWVCRVADQGEAYFAHTIEIAAEDS